MIRKSIDPAAQCGQTRANRHGDSLLALFSKVQVPSYSFSPKQSPSSPPYASVSKFLSQPSFVSFAAFPNAPLYTLKNALPTESYTLSSPRRLTTHLILKVGHAIQRMNHRVLKKRD
mmetsp:Transcript_6289/g.10828  ORF Transcript_6289/g.10828 Transcript_6289/m.10828 type:complete len:117 (+) Transcript_6289:323-673(+)